MRCVLKYLLLILAFQAIGYEIGQTTQSNMGWYDGLEKSAFTPPDIAFPIVWSTLYVLLAIAARKVFVFWRESKDHGLFLLFCLQMVLNWGWSFVFFGAHEIAYGFYWIVVFDIAMLGFIAAAWRPLHKAALLVAPTFLWGLYAGYLNYAIMVLN